MTINLTNKREIEDTRLENDSLVLEGQAEYLENSVYLHGRVIYDGKYAGQYNDMRINLMKGYSGLMTEVSSAIDTLRDYITNNKK